MATFYAKPPHRTPINFASPFAKGLKASYLCRDGAGTKLRSSIGGGGAGKYDLTMSSGNHTVGSGPWGSTVAAGANFWSGTNPLTSTSNWSYDIGFLLTSTTLTGGIVSMGSTSNDANPMLFMEYNNGVSQLRVLLNDASAYVVIDAAATVGTYYRVIGTITTSGANASIYLSKNGAPFTVASSANLTFGGTVHLTTLYLNTGFSGQQTAPISHLHLYNKALSRKEVARFAEPFTMYRGRNVPVPIKTAAAPAGRTTKNTRAFPLGVEAGMDFMGNF